MAGHHEVLWRKRLRWRLRGASQWPTFAVLLVADAILLRVLPIAGDSQPGLVPAFLLSGFFNLVVVAALAPLAGARLRRRRPGMPKVVAEDRAGTWLLLVLAVVLVAAGVAHRPALHAARDDFADEMAAVRRWVAVHAPPEYRRGIDRADTWKQAAGLYRTCVPGPDPDRALCLIVQTGRPRPAIALDPDQQPNARVAGADNPGRLAP